MSSAVSIRTALHTDARAIAEVHVHSWQEAYRGVMADSVLQNLSVDDRERFWLTVLEANGRQTLVLEESGQISGWVAFGVSREPDLEPSETFEIYGIYFHPSAWGRGLGRRLYNVAEERMKVMSVGSIILWVLRENSRARRFYEAMGFVLEPERIKVIDREGTQLPELRYKKNLKL